MTPFVGVIRGLRLSLVSGLPEQITSFFLIFVSSTWMPPGIFGTSVPVVPLTLVWWFVQVLGLSDGPLVLLTPWSLGFGAAIARQLHFALSKGMILLRVILMPYLFTLMPNQHPACLTGERAFVLVVVPLLG
jgi:hypothetical protein